MASAWVRRRSISRGAFIRSAGVSGEPFAGNSGSWACDPEASTEQRAMPCRQGPIEILAVLSDRSHRSIPDGMLMPISCYSVLSDGENVPASRAPPIDKRKRRGPG
jgi:hypothetical protein